MMENMFTDPSVSKQDWQIKVIEARSELIDNINGQFGMKGGGNGTKQWSGTAKSKGSRKEKKNEGINKIVLYKFILNANSYLWNHNLYNFCVTDII